MKQRPPRQPFTEFTHRCRQAQPWLKLYTKGEIVFYLKWRRKKSKLCHLVLLPTTAGPQPDRSPTDTWFVENLASIQLTSDSVSVNCGDIVLGNLIRRQWDKLEMNSGKIDSWFKYLYCKLHLNQPKSSPTNNVLIIFCRLWLRASWVGLGQGVLVIF